MQPLPYHLILDQDRGQLLQTLVQHMDPRGSGVVAAAWAEIALTMLNPRCLGIGVGGCRSMGRDRGRNAQLKVRAAQGGGGRDIGGDRSHNA